jgi:uncharacterized 2Fe-2S/4Fe-4S cluster protein (DUF4445 family)
MIVDSFAEKTVQYSEIQDIVTVLDTSRKFGVSIRASCGGLSGIGAVPMWNIHAH